MNGRSNKDRHPKLTINKHRFGLYAFTLFIILITDSLVLSINADHTAIAIQRYTVIVVAIMLLMDSLIKRKKFSIHFLLLTLFPLCSSFMAGYVFNGYYYYTFIACIWIGMVYGDRYSISEFAEAFCKIMKIICIVSVICFFLRDFLANVSLFPVITSNKGNTYRWLGIISIPLKIHQRGRNFGPFWEPGTFQIYTNMALLLSLFVRENNNKIADAIVFTITGFTTLSGGLLIPMLLIYAAVAFDKQNTKVLIMLLILTVTFFVIEYSGVFDNMLLKIAGDDANRSLLRRWMGIESGVRAFLHNPIFGSSPSYIDTERLRLANLYLNSDYASAPNTFASLFGYFGLYIGGFFIYSSYKLFVSIGKKKGVAILLFLSFIFATSNENMTTSTFFVTFCLLQSGVCRSIAPMKGERVKA